VFAHLEGWLRAHLYAVVFVGAFVDALGVPFPGRIMLLTAGSVSGATRGAGGAAFLVVALAVIGTVIGDHVWYVLGRSRGHRLFALYCRIVRLPASRTATAGRLVLRFGGPILVLGRLAAALRLVITPLAVSRGMSYAQFLLWDGLGAVLWAAGLVWLGHVAGTLGAGNRIWRTLAILGALGAASVVMSAMTRRWLARRTSPPHGRPTRRPATPGLRRRTWRRALLLVVILGVASACSNVPVHRTLPPMNLGEPAFFPTLEAHAEAPIVGGNRLTVLLNGEQIYPGILAAIRGARTTITYAQYSYEDGPIAQDLAGALAERCRAGVRAHVLLDSVGTLAMPREYVELMSAAGCQVVAFRPIGPFGMNRVNNRNHRRILVVDGRIGFTGGSGVSEKWMGDGRTPDHWRDTDVRIEGPVVEYLQGAFAENWVEATGVVLGGADYFPAPAHAAGQTHAQIIRSGPQGGSYAVYTTFLLAIASARRSIEITNPYVLLDDQMIETLVQAARRGVQIRFLVPGVTDHPLVRYAGRRQFGRLLEAGIEIYEYTAALLHAKTMVIDGIWATIGSANLDYRSFRLNDELNVVAYDRAFAAGLAQVFQEDLRYAKRIDLEAWKDRALGGRVLELLAIPFQSYL
jgi:cardiolipin synthase